MAKRKGEHKSDKEQYNAYSTTSRREVNRKRKLKKHLKKHANDMQATLALKRAKPFRQASKVKGNFPTKPL